MVLSAGAAAARLLALQAACVFPMVVVLCNGFEAALLVLVAMKLARRAPARVGWLWIAAQTFLLGVGITLHWSLRPASCWFRRTSGSKSSATP